MFILLGADTVIVLYQCMTTTSDLTLPSIILGYFVLLLLCNFHFNYIKTYLAWTHRGVFI